VAPFNITKGRMWNQLRKNDWTKWAISWDGELG